jgi:hypothetical protein
MMLNGAPKTKGETVSDSRIRLSATATQQGWTGAREASFVVCRT